MDGEIIGCAVICVQRGYVEMKWSCSVDAGNVDFGTEAGNPMAGKSGGFKTIAVFIADWIFEARRHMTNNVLHAFATSMGQ